MLGSPDQLQLASSCGLAQPILICNQFFEMARMDEHRSGCPINLTLEVLGDRWSLIVIRDIMFGNRRHFRQLMTLSDEGIASNVLADRLKRLLGTGLLSKSDNPAHRQEA